MQLVLELVALEVLLDIVRLVLVDILVDDDHMIRVTRILDHIHSNSTCYLHGNQHHYNIPDHIVCCFAMTGNRLVCLL